MKKIEDAARAALENETPLEDLRNIANLLLFSLWETETDPTRPPWPGGPEEEKLLRMALLAETSA